MLRKRNRICKIFSRNLSLCIEQNALFERYRSKIIVENIINLLYNINIYSKEVNYEDF